MEIKRIESDWKEKGLQPHEVEPKHIEQDLRAQGSSKAAKYQNALAAHMFLAARREKIPLEIRGFLAGKVAPHLIHVESPMQERQSVLFRTWGVLNRKFERTTGYDEKRRK